MPHKYTPTFPKNLDDYAPWVSEFGLTAPYGECQCGCGKQTNLAPTSRTNRQWKKDEPKRYILGHASAPIIPVATRFWDKVRKTRGCWLWTGSTGEGYGQLNVEGKLETAHRISWEMHYGPIPDGMWVLHKCDNRPCVNPSHLFLGTPQDNMDDKMAKGRANNAKGENTGNAKLTEKAVRSIRKDLARGESQSSVARRYGVYSTTIWLIAHGRTWTHVT